MAKRKGRPPKIDVRARSAARDSAPNRTRRWWTAEFMRTELTSAATVLKALVKQKRGATVERRAEQAELKRYGYKDEHRRHEPEQLSVA